MDKPKSHAKPVEGGIVPTRYESDAHANQVGLSDEEALMTEVPVEYVAPGNEGREPGARDVESDEEF